jgi:hypothetical protein
MKEFLQAFFGAIIAVLIIIGFMLLLAFISKIL